MAVHYRTKGFVFKKTDRGEADRIFSVFTEDFGRLELTARAIRKVTSKLKGEIDIFFMSDIEFIQGKNQKTLTDAAKLKKTASNLYNMDAGNKISEILDSFIKGPEQDKNLFLFLEEVLENALFNLKPAKNPDLTLHYFFWNFLSLQGYKLQFSGCSACKGSINPYNVYFSAKDGGALCKSCAQGSKNAEKINSDVVKTMRLVLNKDWEIVSKLKIGQQAENILSNIFESAMRSFAPSNC